MTLTEHQIKRLRWQCRRGMKELDVLFERYLYNHLPTADDSYKAAFVELIETQDPIIIDYLTGKSSPDNILLLEILQLMQNDE
jgi:antitoxin CptB